RAGARPRPRRVHRVRGARRRLRECGRGGGAGGRDRPALRERPADRPRRGERAGPARMPGAARRGRRDPRHAGAGRGRAGVVSAPLQGLLDEGVATGVFPCARAIVLARGTRAFDGGAGGATARTVFDLASLTKVMGTTPAFLALWHDGKVEPETPVARFAPASALGQAGATLADLLTHRAGLPAFVPLFDPVLRLFPALRAADCPADTRRLGRQSVVTGALITPPEAPPRTRAVYSDVGFVVLGEILALAAGMPLDALVAERVAVPLGLSARFRRLSAPPAAAPGPIAPTGATRPREPAPGQTGSWTSIERRPSRP